MIYFEGAELRISALEKSLCKLTKGHLDKRKSLLFIALMYIKCLVGPWIYSSVMLFSIALSLAGVNGIYPADGLHFLIWVAFLSTPLPQLIKTLRISRAYKSGRLDGVWEKPYSNKYGRNSVYQEAYRAGYYEGRPD